jgi:hypothetical protein
MPVFFCSEGNVAGCAGEKLLVPEREPEPQNAQTSQKIKYDCSKTAHCFGENSICTNFSLSM